MNDGDSRIDTEVAVFSLVEQSFNELGLPPDAKKASQLTDLVSLLSHWAQRINLTGHKDPLEMTSRLILDAVALSAIMPEFGELGSLADLGSGAGFPGLPIAVMNPHLDVYLVDSRLKRNHFQREARRRLETARVHPILGRSDEVAAVECDAVVAQAMTQPEQAFKLMTPWVKPGGLIILPASEGTVAPETPAIVDQLEERSYTVPSSGIRRLLWVARVAEASR
jgi:16S rRNA (guanine527-N7)-methyltransferase